MVLKATSIMFASQTATTLILFLRNILVARLISVEDFGIAATFSILFAVIETASDMSVKKLLVQDREGEDPRFQNTLHSVQLIRGLVSTALMLAIATPYAAFVKTPDLVWAYQMMAVIPLARSLLHLDMFRVQREMDFRPFAINIVASPVVSLLAVGAIYLVYPDYRIMLGAIITQQLTAVVLSHLLARRRFGLAWDWDYVRRTFRFGMPLLFNGMLLMVITQGERMIVANQTDLTTLGWFSAAFLLASAPGRIMGQTANALFLPKLSRAQDTPDAFRSTSLLALEVTVTMGIWVAVGLAIAGPALMVGLFGSGYAPGAVVLVLLGLGQAVRIARTAPNTTSMAAGRTTALLYTGILRALGILAAYGALLAGYGVIGVAVAALVSEAAALLYGLWLNARHHGLPLRRTVWPLLAFAAVIGLVCVDLAIAPPSDDPWEMPHRFQLVLLAAAALSALAMPRMLGWAMGEISRRRGRSPAA
ncbi:MAG: oligosaccharide flippase family protein [Alphaproteobacteria bacterium]|nr:oligosaccharide flippase family protein [Alphaproteobacteria bacterium]